MSDFSLTRTTTKTMKLGPEKGNKKYGGSDAKKDNCVCY